MSSVDRQLARANDHLERGDVWNAVEVLRDLLATDPNHAEAHAVLAACLLRQRRVHAATYEAKLALTLDPESLSAQLSAGMVAFAARHLSDAERHFQAATALAPDSPMPLRHLAHLELLRGRRREAVELGARAVAMAPDDPDLLTSLGEIHLACGQTDEADRLAREALALQPDHTDALVLRGNTLLRLGSLDDARTHAVWALRADAGSRDALFLLVSVKARESLLLGIWWRYAAWMGGKRSSYRVLLLLLAFVAYRVVTLMLENASQHRVASMVSFAWLGIVLYSWVAPVLFQRMVRREMDEVSFGPDF